MAAITTESRNIARYILGQCGIPIEGEFHHLSPNRVNHLLAYADVLKYRKPKNANGSRGRYFHDLMQRRAR